MIYEELFTTSPVNNNLILFRLELEVLIIFNGLFVFFIPDEILVFVCIRVFAEGSSGYVFVCLSV